MPTGRVGTRQGPHQESGSYSSGRRGRPAPAVSPQLARHVEARHALPQSRHVGVGIKIPRA